MSRVSFALLFTVYVHRCDKRTHGYPTAVFRYSVSVPKIYNTRDVDCRFSVLAVRISERILHIGVCRGEMRYDKVVLRCRASLPRNCRYFVSQFEFQLNFHGERETRRASGANRFTETLHTRARDASHITQQAICCNICLFARCISPHITIYIYVPIARGFTRAWRTYHSPT